MLWRLALAAARSHWRPRCGAAMRPPLSTPTAGYAPSGNWVGSGGSGGDPSPELVWCWQVAAAALARGQGGHRRPRAWLSVRLWGSVRSQGRRRDPAGANVVLPGGVRRPGASTARLDQTRDRMAVLSEPLQPQAMLSEVGLRLFAMGAVAGREANFAAMTVGRPALWEETCSTTTLAILSLPPPPSLSLWRGRASLPPPPSAPLPSHDGNDSVTAMTPPPPMPPPPPLCCFLPSPWLPRRNDGCLAALRGRGRRRRFLDRRLLRRWQRGCPHFLLSATRRRISSLTLLPSFC